MLVDRLKPIIERNDALAAMLSTEEVINDIAKLTALSKEKSESDEIVAKAKEYLKVLDDITSNKALLEDKARRVSQRGAKRA